MGAETDRALLILYQQLRDLERQALVFERQGGGFIDRAATKNHPQGTTVVMSEEMAVGAMNALRAAIDTIEAGEEKQ